MLTITGTPKADAWLGITFEVESLHEVQHSNLKPWPRQALAPCLAFLVGMSEANGEGLGIRLPKIDKRVWNSTVHSLATKLQLLPIIYTVKLKA